MQFKGNPDKLKKLEIGMIEKSAETGVPFDLWLEKHITTPEGGEFDKTPYYGMSNYDKVLYRETLKMQGKTPEPDAFEILMAIHDIKATGSYTDTVSKFFANSDSVVLFPVYMTNRIYATALRMGIWDKFVAEVTTIQGLDFRKIYLEDSEKDRQAALGSRGAEAPKKHFKVKKEQVELNKYLHSIIFDYESIYNTPLNLYNTVLDRVAAQFAIDETDDMVTMLINGDGNSNGLESAQTVETVTSGSIEKLDIIGLKSALPVPYELDVFLGKKAYMRKFWDALSDMQNPAQQWGMTGMTLPRGYDWDRDVVTADRFYGVDSKRAIGYVTNDAAIMTETDKIISKQEVETVISKRCKFHVIDQDGIGCLDIEQ